VQPGERVLVRRGIYREHVKPLRGGHGPDAVVTFEAEPGHGTVIRGSVVLASEWRSSTTDLVWAIRLPEAEFGAQNPFARENVDKSDPSNYQSTVPEQVSAADTQRRGLLFQDGRRLGQVSGPGALGLEPGKYWVDDDGRTIHVRTFGDRDPNTACMEATHLSQCFAPDEPGVSFLRLRGFVIEHVGNGFAYPVEGAISPMGGHHWIIEDNVVRHVNADAINIGSHLWEIGGNPARGAGRDCIVRRNEISDCGVSGIKGLTVNNCVIEDNVLDHIGWQNVERWYDNGGMKLLVCTNTLVRHNLVRNVVDGPGIWLDWDIVNCRATQNVIVDGRTESGAIFLEGSEQLNWIDHNVIWNMQGNGVYGQDCDGSAVFDNFIGRCSEFAVLMRVGTTRLLHGRPVSCKKNHVHRNVFVENRELVSFSDPDNTSDHNLVTQVGAT
jgi:hypothetical protein